MWYWTTLQILELFKPFILALFLILQVVDFCTTLYALRHGASELNPVLKMLIDRFGIIAPLASFKVGCCIAAWLIFMHHPIILTLLTCFYIYVAINNAVVIIKITNA
jgi:hypothetical protein